MTSRKLYFALLVNFAIAALIGCSSEKADDDFDLSGFNYEEFQVDIDPLLVGAVQDSEPAEECASVKIFVVDGFYEIRAQGGTVSSIYFAKGDALNHLDALENALEPVREKWKSQPDGNQISVQFKGAPWADNPVDFVKIAKTYRPLIGIVKKMGFSDVRVNWEHDIQTVLNKETSRNRDVLPEEKRKEIHEYSYLTYRALGLHYDTPRETAAKYHNRPRCKAVNHALLDSLKKASQLQRDLERVQRDLERVMFDGLDTLTCQGCGGVGSNLCSERKNPLGKVKKIDEYDINVKGPLSKNEILKRVRQRTPGLRHLYNRFLRKKNPNFEGLVKLKLAINSSGEVDSISVVRSTTGVEEFDEEIKTAVGRWIFEKVESGNTTAEITLEFVLNEKVKDAKF